MNLDVVILAAGKGTRMNSMLPKVLHEIGGVPMLEHVLRAADSLESSTLNLVVGFGAELIQQHFSSGEFAGRITWACQDQQLGTGHAVQQAMPNLKTDDNQVLILYGDVPLIKADTLARLLAQSSLDSLNILTLITDEPFGLGRMIRDDNGAITAIVEEKDASTKQKQIKEINSGIMVMPARKLSQWLAEIDNSNEQGEYYLTDVVGLAHKEGFNIGALVIEDELEIQGVNDKAQLAKLERHYQMTKVDELLQAGVTIRDPARVDIRGEVTTGKDVEIDVNVILEGTVTLGDGVKIGPNTLIKDSVINESVQILAGTQTDGATIGAGSSVGPYARIRPGTVLSEDVKIGNFVETKNAIIGKGSKASHLAYLGDVELGAGVNIGAGTIVCNYDGVNKHKTIIGDNVFVGSNSVLVAPVVLEDNAFVAAGSAINTDVPTGELAVGRAKQRNIKGWKRPSK